MAPRRSEANDTLPSDADGSQTIDCYFSFYVRLQQCEFFFCRGQYDLVIASERDTADYWGAFTNIPAIFEDIEVIPNDDAMVWFLRELFPRVQAKLPAVRLTITGDHGNRPLPPSLAGKVATSKGAKGLHVEHNEHLLIADTPQAHAEAILRLLQEPGLRQRLADKAFQLIRQKYDWSVVTPRFLDLVERVGRPSPRP